MAGCGKTHAAVALAATDVLNPLSPRKKLVCIRPTVEADRSLGYLPGELSEKLSPYTAPILHVLPKVAYGFPAERLQFEALGYARGVTYEDCVVLLDEAQNASFHQLLLILTRLGRNSKMIICGDPEQADIRSTSKDYECDLDEVADKLEKVKGVAVVDFPEGESLRHPLVSQVLRCLRR